MYKVAVMGDRDSIYGFAAVGFCPFPVTDTEEAAKVLKDLAEKDYAVIYITEAYASDLEREIAHYSGMLLPAIIPIPGISANTGIGMETVRVQVERAVGTDIIFGDD